LKSRLSDRFPGVLIFDSRTKDLPFILTRVDEDGDKAGNFDFSLFTPIFNLDDLTILLGQI